MNRTRRLLALLVAGVAPLAWAEAAPSDRVPPSEGEAAVDVTVDDILQRLARLEEENETLRQEVRRAAAQARKKPPTSSLTLGEAKLRLLGYLDVGFFKASGDGVAYSLDAGKKLHPEFSHVPWVFTGDPWANAINSQGDSADLGLDRTNIARWDPIASGGRPTFIANTLNLGLLASHGNDLLFEASLNFEPRQGMLGAPGDALDVDLAYLEWVPFEGVDLHLFAGKFESTFGIEYRRRKAPDRNGITPSLIARYTVGPQVGIKARGSFLAGHLTYNLALTNGSSSTERFFHFSNELDANSGKTVSGRLSYKLPLEMTLEVGASGMGGAQDLQPSDSVFQWQVGADAHLMVSDLELRAEYLIAKAPGGGIAEAPMLDAEGFYVEAKYQILSWLGALARVDRRSALLLAESNLYVSDVGRVTAGVRFDVNFHLALKAEYLKLVTLGGGPDLDDDVFTTSAIFRF